MDKYDHKKIEAKWPPSAHAGGGVSGGQAEDFSKKPKFYALVEFPYCSGDGLHLGHAFTNTILDILARKKRMSGFNVLYPMGWDSFGLPTENYAIKTGIAPAVVTARNTKRFKEQDKKLGLAYDWDREIDTTDPNYYKWTQWIFLKLFEKGLAYKAETPVGWCPACKIILANEEVVDGKCERCGTAAEQRRQKQWLLKITAYADRLADELDLVDYPDYVKASQRNWIGRKEGRRIKFEIASSPDGHRDHRNDKDFVEIFTTRADTIYGATFVVLSPNHPYIKEKILSLRSRMTMEGVDTGYRVLNPATKKEIPVFVDEYVLDSVGTGAIMGVPAYDERDAAFAKKHKLPVVQAKLTEEIFGEKATNYHLRDWVFSRQHYWGEPIPIVHCDKCGMVPVPEKELPVKLPEVEKYQPTQTGESPLANMTDWVKTKCPKCGGEAKRETDTMPNWAGSSWYYLRFCDPNNDEVFADRKKLDYWGPVDLYLGGAEHTTLHLLYSRFWHKFLNDLDLVPGKEPYAARRQHGMILGENGEKMSKSRGNVINPDELIDKYGADTVRVYLAFMGPYDSTMPWSTRGVEGSQRFILRVWKACQEMVTDKTSVELEALLNKTIKKVGEDIEQLKHNTAVATLMTFLNVWEKDKEGLSKEDIKRFLIILAPFAPYMSEELYQQIASSPDGHRGPRNDTLSVHQEKWPEVGEIRIEAGVMVVMIDGKTRGTVPAGDKEMVERLAREDMRIAKYLEGFDVERVVFVPGRAINFVLKDEK